MAKRGLVFASMLMVVGIVVLANLSSISAQVDCGGDVQSIYMSCIYFLSEGVQKTPPPSQECCGALKKIDVPCFCQKYYSLATEGIISVEKAIHVARTCGHSVDAGFKCGNYTVPPVSATMPEE